MDIHTKCRLVQTKRGLKDAFHMLSDAGIVFFFLCVCVSFVFWKNRTLKKHYVQSQELYVIKPSETLLA